MAYLVESIINGKKVVSQHPTKASAEAHKYKNEFRKAAKKRKKSLKRKLKVR